MTIQEALKASGFTDDQIAALDAKALTAFGGILTTAEQKEKDAAAAAAKAESDRKAAEASAQAAQAAKEAAELEKRSNVEFYETKVMPGLIGYEDEKKALETARINAEAKAAFLQAQIDGAKAAGFVPADAPVFTPTVTNPNNPNPARDPNNGRFVAGVPGSTPGSPTFIEADFYKRLDSGIGGIADIQWKHQTLYGRPLPMSPSELISKADSLKLSPMEFAARTFKFAEKEEEVRQAAAVAHDKQIADAATAAKQQELEASFAAERAKWELEKKQIAESRSSHPEIAKAGPVRDSTLRVGIKSGDFKDPLKMTDAERRAQQRQMIQKEVATQAEGAVA